MRLLVHAPYFRPHVGGVETFTEELAEALWATGRLSGLTIAAPDLPAGAPPEELDAHGTRVLRYPALEPIANFPLPRPAALRVLRDAASPRPDVVLGHTRFFPASALALAQARALRRPYLHVEHGSGPVELDSRPAAAVARAYDRTIGTAVLRGAGARIAISEASRRFVQDLAGRDAVVLRRGLPVQRLDAAAPHPDAGTSTAAGPLVLYVGRLIDGKGVRDLIEACCGLPEDVRCVLVGDGPRRGDLEAQVAAAGLTGRVRFTGQLPEDEALAWMRAADVLVNPSYTEGLPTAVLFAAAMGTPVVATDVGGTREILRDGATGVLVGPRDVRALHSALSALLVDAAGARVLGAAARDDVRGRFDWARTAGTLLDLAAEARAAR